MILVDTSVWIDHLRKTDPRLVRILGEGLVSTHPMVYGELALGSIAGRLEFLELLERLPAAVHAEDEEVMRLIESENLHGRGLGFVDAHLLAGCLLTPGTLLWSRDRRLAGVADSLGVKHG